MALNKLYQIGMNQSNIKALTSFINFTNPPKETVNNNYIQIKNTKIDNHFLEMEEILKYCAQFHYRQYLWILENMLKIPCISLFG